MRIKYILFIVISLFFVMVKPVAASAQIGDMGFFGGISEGRRLPSTIETLIQNAGKRQSTTTLNYSELVFLGGRPELFKGLIDINKGFIPDDSASGTFNVSYRVYPSPNTQGDVTINRTVNFQVHYRIEGNQYIYRYEIARNNWRETIVTPAGTFTLDNRLSSYQTSIIEDRTPGVSYYRGDVSGRLIYSEGGAVTTVDQSGSFYGYSCVWSSTETHRMDVSVINDEWGMQYQIRPSITVNKVLQYTLNEPTAISFQGNYKEVMQNIAGLRYDIFIMPQFMWDESYYGTVSLESINTFEQLPAPDLSFMRGNAAEDDINKLFAMQIFTGDPRYYVPEQAITRGQFMTALAKAVKLPIAEPSTNTRTARNRQPVTTNLFSDVDSNRPEYPYIMALQKAGIAYGRADGKFYFDYPIERQEAFAALIRALGLRNLNVNPTVLTIFTDSSQIADFAIREMAVAAHLGLIFADNSTGGNIYPRRNLTKGEAASLLNHYIEYMRLGLVSDYAEQIVNIAR